MMSEKAISLFGLFFVTSYVAKYVGPSVFGEIALATAIFQIVQIIAQLGGDNIIFKRVSKNRLSGLLLMKASSMIRAGGYVLLSASVILYFLISNISNDLIFIYSVAVALFFSTIDVLLIYNNAILSAKINTIANVIGLLISLIVRYFIALLELNPYYLSIPIILSTLIPYLIRLYIYKKSENRLNRKVSYNEVKVYSKYMILSGISIVFSSIAVAIYTRINQFILNQIDGIASVGIYSVAVTIGMSWSFISQALITSYYSKIYAERNENKAINIAANLNRVIILASLFFIFCITVSGNKILVILYGDEYAAAYYPMVILSFSSLFSSLGMIAYRYIIRMSGFSFLSKKMVVVLFLSFPISYIFIFYHGIIGAACSTLVVEMLSLTIINYFYKKGIIFNLHKNIFKFRRGR